MTERIFISYRRDDSFSEAALICSALQARVGQDAVFMDKRIQAGSNWPGEIRTALEKAHTVLVVVGNWDKWLGVHDFGKRRIDDPKDWVHQEVATALKKGKKLIPVLTGTNSQLLPAKALPKNLERLTEQQRHLLRKDTWDQDLKALVEALCPVPIRMEPQKSAPAPGAESDENHRRFVVVGSGTSIRKKIVAGIIAVTVLCVALFWGYQIHQNNRDQEATKLVNEMLSSSGSDVETYLKQLEQFPDLASGKLVHALNNNELTVIQRMHAANGLVLLGAAELAAPVCQVQNHSYDPEQRTQFIHGFQDFHGNLRRVAVGLDESDLDPDVRSALCLAIGRMGEDARAETYDVIQKLYVEAHDGGTHGAARWALLQQGLTEKDLDDLLPQQPLSDSSRDWYVSKVGQITMVMVPGCSFALGSVTDSKNPTEADQLTTFASFWMSDREISVGQFEALMPELNGESAPTDSAYSTRSRKPAVHLTWFDAVEFCNRLSAEEGLDPYYKIDNEKRDLAALKAADVSIIEPKGHGYRLPTEIEWEYASRAMSAIDYCYGDSETLLSEYAVFQTDTTLSDVCGRCMPNAWGLFDMHGNRYEWCWNKHEGFGDSRVLRGGSVYNYPQALRSASRNDLSPEVRGSNVGFRISRTP